MTQGREFGCQFTNLDLSLYIGRHAPRYRWSSPRLSLATKVSERSSLIDVHDVQFAGAFQFRMTMIGEASSSTTVSSKNR